MCDINASVGLFAGRMGVSLDMDSFEDRLNVQKSFYLLQAFNADLGFGYNWYIRGPYCSELADAAFDIKRHNLAFDGYTLNQNAEKIIDECRRWIENNQPCSMGDIEWKELLASLHFIVHHVIATKDDKNLACRTLMGRKKWYRQEDVEHAWEVLKQRGLIDAEKLN
jgi:uncharacterized protein YwgA